MNVAYQEKIDNLDTLLNLTYNSMHESYDENKLRKAKSDIEQYAKTFEIFSFLKHIEDIKQLGNDILTIADTYQNPEKPSEDLTKNNGCASTITQIATDGSRSKTETKWEIVHTVIQYTTHTLPLNKRPIYTIISFADVGLDKTDLQPDQRYKDHKYLKTKYSPNGIAGCMTCTIDSEKGLTAIKTNKIIATRNLNAYYLRNNNLYDEVIGAEIRYNRIPNAATYMIGSKLHSQIITNITTKKHKDAQYSKRRLITDPLNMGLYQTSIEEITQRYTALGNFLEQ